MSIDCQSEEAVRVQTGETGIVVWLDEETNTGMFCMRTRSKSAVGTTWNPDVVLYLIELQSKIDAFIPTDYMTICTCHRRDDQISGHIPIIGAKVPGATGFGWIGLRRANYQHTSGALLSLKACHQDVMASIMVMFATYKMVCMLW